MELPQKCINYRRKLTAGLGLRQVTVSQSFGPSFAPRTPQRPQCARHTAAKETLAALTCTLLNQALAVPWLGIEIEICLDFDFDFDFELYNMYLVMYHLTKQT